MKRLFIPLMALLVLFLAVGPVNAASQTEEQMVTQEWYLSSAEDEGLEHCLVCETDRQFADPMAMKDWYLLDDTWYVEKEMEPKKFEKVPEPTLEGEIFNDGWYLNNFE